MATHSTILAWRIPRSLVNYSPWGHESDMTEWLTHTHITVGKEDVLQDIVNEKERCTILWKLCHLSLRKGGKTGFNIFAFPCVWIKKYRKINRKLMKWLPTERGWELEFPAYVFIPISYLWMFFWLLNQCKHILKANSCGKEGVGVGNDCWCAWSLS